MMAGQLINLNRPKFHPITGVELDADDCFEFDIQDKGQEINELKSELSKYRAAITDLKCDRQCLLEQVEALQCELIRLNKELAPYRQEQEIKESIKDIEKKFRRDRRILEFQCTGKVTKALMNDLWALKQYGL